MDGEGKGSCGGCDKIALRSVRTDALTQKGFDARGCMGTPCGDGCCRSGADIDQRSIEVMAAHKELVEREVGRDLASCFQGPWLGDGEFLGGDAIRSAVGEDGYCVFHAASGKGCTLYKLVFQHGLPRTIVPTICRLYPLTWAEGELQATDYFIPECNLVRADNTEGTRALDTQRHEVEALFHVPPSLAPVVGVAPSIPVAPAPRRRPAA